MVKRPPKRTGRSKWAVASVLLVACMGLGVLLTMRSNRHTAQVLPGGLRDNAETNLAACSGSVLLFPRQNLRALESWQQSYHQNVSIVVNSVMAQTQRAQCTLTQSENVPTVMLGLASQMPPWRDPNRLRTLRTQDVGSVLLEYLRLYECTLQERASQLPVFALMEVREKAIAENKPLTSIPVVSVTPEESRQLKLISSEMALARPSLHRTLLFLASTMRLGSLGSEMDCLERASADLRNTLGLAAETSACLPRIWDARGALRNSTRDNSSEQ